MKWTCVISMAALAMLLGACGDDNGTNAPATLPRVSNLAVTSNSNNVLSAILTLEPTNVDSSRIVYWTGNEAKQYAPYVGDTAASRQIVLGLRPGTQYNFAVEALNSRAQRTSDTVTFTTDTLPTFLASSSFAGATPSSGGYVLTSMFDGTSAHVVAFDSTGRLAWYRSFPGAIPSEEVKQQANGDITAILTTSHGGEPVPGQAVAIAPDGSIRRTITPPDSSYLDGHEFWELTDAQGAYAGAVFFAYTARHSTCPPVVDQRTLWSRATRSSARMQTARTRRCSMRGTTLHFRIMSSRAPDRSTSIIRTRSHSRRTATTSSRGEISM